MTDLSIDNCWKEAFRAVGMEAQEVAFTPNGTKKILTVCQGGASRSVACAFLLKYKYKLDAIACSWERNSWDTIEMLCRWADVIIVMRAGFLDYISQEFQSKVKIVEVGRDRWANGTHPELLKIVDEQLKLLIKEL